MRSGVKPLHSFADTLSLMSFGLITMTLSERGRYFGRGALRTGLAFAIYKCNKVSSNYSAQPSNDPPLNLSGVQMNYPENIKEGPPKTERCSLALP